ncbi:unnamed protein product, partial [Heterosigma akashiwo]
WPGPWGTTPTWPGPPTPPATPSSPGTAARTPRRWRGTCGWPPGGCPAWSRAGTWTSPSEGQGGPDGRTGGAAW